MGLIMSKKILAEKHGISEEELSGSINRKKTKVKPSFDLLDLAYKLSRKILEEGINFATKQVSLGMIPQLMESVKSQPGKDYLNRVTVDMVKTIFGEMIDGDPKENARKALEKRIVKDLMELSSGGKQKKEYECPKLNSKIKFYVTASGGLSINASKMLEGHMFPFNTIKVGGIDMPKFSFGMTFIIRI